MSEPPVDCHGRPVFTGSKIRVLSIPLWLRSRLPADEWANLQSMVGEAFVIDEVDEYGQPWVSKDFEDEKDGKHSHSIALDKSEIELVG